MFKMDQESVGDHTVGIYIRNKKSSSEDNAQGSKKQEAQGIDSFSVTGCPQQ